MSETPPIPPAAERPEGSKRFSRGCFFVGGILATLLIVGLMTPCTWIIHPNDQNNGRMRELGRALSSYATAHEGRLPPTLWELTPIDLTQKNLADLRYWDVKKGERFDWLYFPKEKLDGLPPATILLAAPGTSGNGPQWRLVWRAEGVILKVPEADFQRLIREQNR